MDFDDAFHAASRAWPTFTVPKDFFEAFVRERVGDGLAEAAVDELFLAAGCLQGVPAALEAFEAYYVVELPSVLARFGERVAEEATQDVRVKLFGPARVIGEFRGTGDLRGWLKVVALRAALTLTRRRKDEVEPNDRVLGDLESDLELGLLRKESGEVVKAALASAIGTLEPRERLVLRMHLVDRLNIDQIGTFYRVNRVTAYRWVTAAREKLVGLTREALRARLKLEESELNSLLRHADSQLDMSLRRIL